jgi:polyphosphate kinase
MGGAGRLNKMLQSPFTLHDTMLKHINEEIEHARRGRPARVIAKMNALIEPKIIQALYRASQANVKVDLIVRGMCALKPGIQGISDNINVHSIIGRFLEHTRVFYFENDGEPRLYLSSADWMGRNFFNRVETCFPIDDPGSFKRVVSDLELYLADSSAWLLTPDGTYEQRKSMKRSIAQERLLQSLPG